MATIHLPPGPSSPADIANGEDSASTVAAKSPGAWGALLVVAVTALGLLLASFPARNSDLWLHLAAGRRLIPNQVVDSVQTIHGVALASRVNQGWLYNVLVYGVYSAVGGSGLVFVKALVVAALAVLLMHLSRVGAQRWIPALCTAFAILAMSPRLQLQPTTVSCLMLALTCWFLRRQQQSEKRVLRDAEGNDSPGSSTDHSSWLPHWPLIVVFVVWANMDRWFVLGLGVAALVWLGQTFDLARRGGRHTNSRLVSMSSRRAVWLAVLAAVCLLNPASINSLAGHGEGGWSGLIAPAVSGGTRLTTSPFQVSSFASFGSSPAGLAYLALLGLGLLSFLLRFSRWSWQWLLPWLGLAILSGFEVRAIPFFAVLAGPVLAWNLEAFLDRRFPADGRRNFVPLVAASLCGLAVLIICAWLQGPPSEPRQWAIETAPSLERGALAVRSWHQDGKLTPDMRGLHLSPETASAFAWFCPEAKGLFDDRLTDSIGTDPDESGGWPAQLRSAGISYVTVYDPDRTRLFATLSRLLADPHQWPLLCIEGDLAVFGWRDSARVRTPDPFADLELDMDRLAFHPKADQRAPRQRPERAPASRRWWETFWRRTPPRPLDRDAAAFHLLHAEALRRTAPNRHLAAWETNQAAALVSSAVDWTVATPPVSLCDAQLRLTVFQPLLPESSQPSDRLPPLTQQVLAWQQRFTWQHDDTPSALLYLAIRAARKAIAADPDVAHAHLILGESYLRLLHNTRERAWGQRFPELVDLRSVQASAALNQAIALQPDLAQAHFDLGALYTELGYLDLALKHRRTYLQLIRKTGPPAGVGKDQFQEAAAEADRELGQLAQALAGQESEFAKQSAGKRVGDRAALAARKGLAAKALETLLSSDLAAFGTQGSTLELELLLRTGRVKDVLEWMDPAQKEAIGVGHYYWLRTQALAASGDYSLAEAECEQLARVTGLGEQGPKNAGERELMAFYIGLAILDESPEGQSVASASLRASRQAEFRTRVVALGRSLRQQADAHVLRGLLALEEGDVRQAGDAFRRALLLCGDATPTAPGARLDFNARPAALGCLEWLK